jgi:hypothetical protein
MPCSSFRSPEELVGGNRARLPLPELKEKLDHGGIMPAQIISRSEPSSDLPCLIRESKGFVQVAFLFGATTQIDVRPPDGMRVVASQGDFESSLDIFSTAPVSGEPAGRSDGDQQLGALIIQAQRFGQL